MKKSAILRDEESANWPCSVYNDMKTYSHDAPNTVLMGATNAFPRAEPMPSAALLITDPITKNNHTFSS